MTDVIAYNGQDKWKQKATELLNQGGGGGGLVDDVKVNGTSVVDENKVAQIDLSDYATHSYVTNALDEYTTTAVLQANYYNKTEVNSRLADKADANSVYTKTETNTLLSAKANASDVYTKSETYSDDEVDALLSAKADTADLATVATSGSYSDLSNKPTIPSAQVNSDWNASSGVAEILNKPNLATVATSGSYNDLTNKPSIPTKTSDLTNDSNFVADSSYVHTDNNFTTAEKTKLSDIASGAEVNVQSDWSQSDNTADDYIKNKPTIPTVNNGTLTIKNGDQTKGTFSANQSTAANVVMLPFDITGNTTIGFTPVYPS